jgi:hypothetical protein
MQGKEKLKNGKGGFSNPRKWETQKMKKRNTSSATTPPDQALGQAIKEER